jgi:TusA-related sulfurtransferase
MTEPVVADLEVDITGEICPMTYVRTRLALDRLQSGEILAVLLRGKDPLGNVQRSARRQGHAVLALQPAADGATRLLIRRK